MLKMNDWAGTGRELSQLVLIMGCLVCASHAQDNFNEDAKRTLPRGPEVRGLYSGLHVSDVDLSGRQIGNAVLSEFTFQCLDFVREISLRNVSVQGSEVQSLALQGQLRESDVVSDFRVASTRVQDLIIEGMHVRRLVFVDSDIKRLELRRCAIEGLEIVGGRVDQLNIKNCSTANLTVSRDSSFNRVEFNGWSIEWLDFGNLDFSSTKVRFSQTLLRYPRLPEQGLDRVDLRGLLLERNFVLWQEKWIRGRGKSSPLWNSQLREASLTYFALSDGFQQIGRTDLSRQMYYRARVCQRDSSPDSFYKVLSGTWGEYFRGRYGTSWQIIVCTGFILWISYSLVFIVLGLSRFAWSAEILRSPVGESSAPRLSLVTPYGDRTFGSYVVIAGIVSIEHLLIVGGNVFQITGFSDLIRPVSKQYIVIGIGRPIAISEAAFGLVLLVNFVRAFVATLLA